MEDGLTRYLTDLANDHSLGTLPGMFVAQSIKPQARTLAEYRGITCVEVDYDQLRGRESNTWTLFS
jgi:RecB family endonuclease NucS